jgi:glucose-fructose oxidoreductase
MLRRGISRRGLLQASLAAGGLGVVPATGARTAGSARASRPLGVALVGLGSYSEGRLAPALQLTRHCRLSGIVSGSPHKIEDWQRRYRIPDGNVYDYSNFARIADNRDIDVVYVVLPNHLHATFSIAAAEAGKHVWCEKPMAMDADEAGRMIAAGRRNKVRLAIGYRLQHEPNTRRLIGFADGKPYGAIRTIRAEAGFHAFGESDRGHWRLDPSCGGGAMYDVGIYALNGARSAVGRAPLAVSATHEVRRQKIFDRVDETTRFQMEFPGGIEARCIASFGQNFNLLRVDCERGWYELSPFQSYDGIRGHTSDGQALDAVASHQQAQQMDADALAILERRAVRVPGEEGLADMRVVDAIFASARDGGRRIALAS